MGVLLVDRDHGTGLVPDWREVGCGAETGRLTLTDGTQWVREACADRALPATVADDFNRADGTLGSPWSFPHGQTFSIVSGKAVYTGAAANEPIAVVTGPSTYDVRVRADLTIEQHPGASLIFNYLSPGNFHMWNVSTGTSAIYKFTGHVPVQIGTPSVALSATYAVETTAAGDIRCYQNGAYVGTTSTTWHDGGYGAGVQSSTLNKNPADNFSVAKLTFGHPLFANIGTVEDPDWVQVACMIAPQTVGLVGTYDDALYDDALYG